MSDEVMADNEVMVLTKRKVETDPNAIGENLAQLAMALEDNKEDLISIKNRGFWEKLTNNNTRDLAEVMLKQNDTISAFLIIVQGIIFLSMNNVVALGGIMDALNKSATTNEISDNRYIEMAKDYLSEAIKSTQKVNENETQIKSIKSALSVYYKNQYNQGEFIKDLAEELKFKTLSDEQRDKTIRDLSNKIDKNFSIDKQQEEILFLLQEKIDSQEKDGTEELMQELGKLREEKNNLNLKIDNISLTAKKRIIIAYTLGCMGILVGLVAILI